MEYRDKRIGVLMGGRSARRERSLHSGRRVLRTLLDLGYSAAGIDLTDPRQVLELRLDVAFLTLHGGEGQDGTIQTLLELCGIPYTGPGAATSALCSQRVLVKRILGQAGVPTPRFLPLSELDGAHMDLDRVRGRLTFPVLVKPVSEAAGLAAHHVANEVEFLERVPELKSCGAPLLAEEFVAGRELIAGVLGEQVLPPVELRRPPELDAEQAGAALLVVPAPIEPRLEASVRRVARRALDAVGGCVFGQVNLRLDEAGIPWVTSVETLPELGEEGSFARQAAAAGCRYDELLVCLLEGAALKKPAPRWIVETLPAMESRLALSG